MAAGRDAAIPRRGRRSRAAAVTPHDVRYMTIYEILFPEISLCDEIPPPCLIWRRRNPGRSVTNLRRTGSRINSRIFSVLCRRRDASRGAARGPRQRRAGGRARFNIHTHIHGSLGSFAHARDCVGVPYVEARAAESAATECSHRASVLRSVPDPPQLPTCSSETVRCGP